jgi:hypothetical protein
MTRAWSRFALTAGALGLAVAVVYLGSLETVPPQVSATLVRDRCACAIEEAARGETLEHADALDQLDACEGVEVDVLDDRSVIVRATWIDWRALTVREVSTRIDLPVARARPRWTGVAG